MEHGVLVVMCCCRVVMLGDDGTHWIRACLNLVVDVACRAFRVRSEIHYCSGTRRLSCHTVSYHQRMSWTVLTGSLQGQRRQMLDWFQAAKPAAGHLTLRMRVGRSHEAFISSRGVNSPIRWPSNRSICAVVDRRKNAILQRLFVAVFGRSLATSFCWVSHLCKTSTSRDRSPSRRAF